MERVLFKMGFRDTWVRRVMSCITSVSFTFKINGRVHGEVIPSRGLRQGDLSQPISLFCVLMLSPP